MLSMNPIKPPGPDGIIPPFSSKRMGHCALVQIFCQATPNFLEGRVEGDKSNVHCSYSENKETRTSKSNFALLACAICFTSKFQNV